MSSQPFHTVNHVVSDEGNVTKLVFRSDTAVAEAVLYRYPTYEERTVICCSTMSGCPVGCRFCGAGDYFARSLTAEEIIYQVEESIRYSGVDPEDMKRFQIMFMSMGEPMLNQRGLEEAIRWLAVAYPDAALLVSTMGPKLKSYDWFYRLSQEIPQVGLQFSIHETDQELRDKLIPFGAKLSLGDISYVGLRWFQETGRKPFFNYCASDHNTGHQNAAALFQLFHPAVWEATVSVICERNEGMPARNDHQQALATAFSEKLLSLGFNVRVFDPAGQDDIGGGCGQLWFVQRWMEDHPELVRPSIGNGMDKVHAPSTSIH